MAGTICLQGGAEFGPACAAMDSNLLRRVGTGLVVVSALAGAVGADYRAATANGVRYYRALGAHDVRAAPDAREDPTDALAVLGKAALVVLPGGSPRRLHAALTQTPVGALLIELVKAGVMVMGASAGAMLLCATTVLPENGPSLAPGLGLVPDALVLPHFTTGAAHVRQWSSLPVPPGTVLLGLPECAGLLMDGATYTAAGAAPSTIIEGGVGRELAVGATWTR